MKRFQGRSAEKAFSKLCSDKGVTCNPSAEDDHGWDHIVEFPHTSQAGVSADMQRTMPAIFVQTKSHSSNGFKVTMKLSNALKMVRSPSPTFVILRTSPSPESQGDDRWYAVHFWGTLIVRVLKRVREASRGGIAEERFHEKSFSFTMNATDEKTNEILLSWIAETVQNVGNDYAEAKKLQQPAPEHFGEVKLGARVTVEQLVDHQLGLTPHIPLVSFKIIERRFGVDIPLSFPIPIEDVVWSRATMHAHPADECDIRLLGPDGSVIELVGDVTAPALPNLPESEQKIRIRASFFEVIWRFVGEPKFSASFNTEAKQSPAELEKIARFMSWNGQGNVDVQVTVRDQPLLYGSVNTDDIDDQGMFSALVDQLGTLKELSQHLRAATPQISFAEFFESDDVFNLYRFVRGEGLEIKWELAESQHCPEIKELIAMGSANVGNWHFAAIQRYPMIQRAQEGNEFAINFGDPMMLQRYAFRDDDGTAFERIDADFKRYVSKSGVLGISGILSEFAKSDEPQLPKL